MISEWFYFRRYHAKMRALNRVKENAYADWEKKAEDFGCATCSSFNNDTVQKYADRLKNCSNCSKMKSVLELANLADETELAADEFLLNEYAKAVFQYYSRREPELIRNATGDSFSWKEVFDEEFDQLSQNLRYSLVGLVEKEGKYRLK